MILHSYRGFIIFSISIQNEGRSPHNPIMTGADSRLAAVFVKLVKLTLLCSPSEVQLRVRVFTRTTSLGRSSNFLSTKELLATRILCFSVAFCEGSQPFFYPPQFKNQQILKIKKQVEGEKGVGKCTSLLSGILASQVLVALSALNYNFCIPSPMKKAFLSFHLLKLHSPFAKRPQMSEVLAALATYQCLHIDFFFFKSGFSSYSQQEFWSATICSIIARIKIYIFHKQWKRQIFIIRQQTITIEGMSSE